MTTRRRADESLPRLFVDARRGHLLRLVGTGLAQAGLIVVTALLMPILLGATGSGQRLLAAGGLGLGAVALGVARWQERVQAERLGQDYVQEIRSGLVASSLRRQGPSVGITIARTTNDLTSVRNWVALGLTPLVVGTPIIIGAVVALLVLHPLLALAVGAPVALLGAVLAALARPHYRRSRELRRLRGRLAAQVSDTVHAAVPIRVAGGERREVRRVAERGRRVAAAAVARAEIAGLIRGAAVGAAAVASVAVAAVGAWGHLPSVTIATALTIVGVLAGPVADLGRVVEYRQSYRAARRIIGPALAGASGSVARGPVERDPEAPPGLTIRGLVVADQHVADLHARPGEAVVLRSDRPGLVHAVIDTLAGLNGEAIGEIRLGGAPLLDLAGEQRRDLVGHAGRDLPLERGSIKRLVRYRRPSSTEPIDELLGRVGLADRVASLADGHSTVLRRGGAPLTGADQARVKLARAVYDEPELVILDHIDAQLGAAGRVDLRAALADLRGVVLVDSDDPGAFLSRYREWHLDEGVMSAAPNAAPGHRAG